MKQARLLAPSVLWLTMTATTAACAHDPGQVAGTGMFMLGGLTALGGVLVTSGGCASFDENDPQPCGDAEREPDPDKGLPMIGAGLATAVVGAGIAAASTEQRRRRSRAAWPRKNGQRRYRPQKIPSKFPEEEVALLSRAYRQQQRHPVDDRYRCVDLSLHGLHYTDPAPSRSRGLDRCGRCPALEGKADERPRR